MEPPFTGGPQQMVENTYSGAIRQQHPYDAITSAPRFVEAVGLQTGLFYKIRQILIIMSQSSYVDGHK